VPEEAGQGGSVHAAIIRARPVANQGSPVPR